MFLVVVALLWNQKSDYDSDFYSHSLQELDRAALVQLVQPLVELALASQSHCCHRRDLLELPHRGMQLSFLFSLSLVNRVLIILQCSQLASKAFSQYQQLAGSICFVEGVHSHSFHKAAPRVTLCQ